MPDLNEVMEEAQREVKRLGGDVKTVKDNIERDLANLRSEVGNKADGAKVDVLVKEKMDAFGASITEKMDALKKSADDRADAIEVAMKRQGGGAGAGENAEELRKNAILFTKSAMITRGEKNIPDHLDDDKIDVEGYKNYRKHFHGYLRAKDDRLLSSDAVKFLSVGSDPDGGYMVETTVSSRILEKVWETSPVRRLATVETISGTELEIRLDTDETDFEWVGETDLPDADKTPQLGKKRIIAHTMAARPKATQQLLEDASVDMAAWLSRKVGEKFGRGEARAFLLGTGRGQPRGLLTYPDGKSGETIERRPSGAADAYTFEGLIGMIYSLKEAYHANATWMMRRTSIPRALTLKDGEGRYIFQMLLNPGQKGLATSLCGYPLDMAADMPTLTAGAIGAAFGDFRAAYTIVDRLGITTLRDPYTVKPFVEFYTRKRVGGDVVNFEAFKVMIGAAGDTSASD